MLIFKNVDFVLKEGLSTQIKDIKEFLMRPSGHYILDVGITDVGKADGYTNKIYITNKSSFDYSTAVFTPQITYSGGNQENQPNISSGQFINNSLQNTLTFNITTQEYTLDNNDEEKK